MKDSDSYVQKEIEKTVLKKIGLKPETIFIENVKFCFDGFSDEKKVIAEIYAGIENLKSAQRQKISQDILKMILFEKLKGETFTKKLIFVDKKIYDKLIFEESKSWKNLAIKKFNIKLEYVQISNEDYDLLVKAKQRQGKYFSKIKLV